MTTLSLILASLLFGQAPLPPGAPTITGLSYACVETLLASSGDGSSCTVYKGLGSFPALGFTCISADGKTTMGPLDVEATDAVQTMAFSFGDLVCLFGLNPTGTAAPLGSLGTVAPSTMNWACSGNLRTAGVVTGQSTVVSGVVTWP